VLYKLEKVVLRYWYSVPSWLTYLLWPFSVIYCLIILLRKHYLLRKKVCFNIPVIVVGNITVGGTGKTPFVIWLAQFLKSKGYRPGIVSRGYGGKSRTYPLIVTSISDVHQTGDEALLLSLRTNCPVVIDPDRVNAVQFLLNHTECNIIISDDGLQHYRLSRDIEIVIIDGERQMGNGFCLPAGPLREPVTRLRDVDFMIVNEQREGENLGYGYEYSMNLMPGNIYNLSSPELEVEPGHFLGEPIHAIAGIGNPERFFSLLRNLGLSIWPHSFSDHHQYTEKELDFNIEHKIIMTEKDAVKCKRFADYHYWCLPVSAELDPQLGEAILVKIQAIESHPMH
jgi:tetraacyldisaccharide 4'-kinase